VKKLLLVVDYQRDFVDGALGFPGAEALDGLIAAKIDAYRAAGDDVAFTMDTHAPDYLHTQEGRKLPVPHCAAGTEGWELYGATARAARPEDLRFQKPSFPSLELANWLRGRSYGQVELCGLVSYICVVSNAVMVKAALPETEILVDARCTAGPDARLHQAALDILSCIQVTVTGRSAS
jgi:nicotinamidase/pyrazinamidase